VYHVQDMTHESHMFEMHIAEHSSSVSLAIVLKHSVYYAVCSKLVCHYKHSHGEKEREQG